MDFSWENNIFGLEDNLKQWVRLGEEMEKYVIRGEVSDDLDTILHTAPESLLDWIMETWNMAPENVDRPGKEAMTKEVIEKTFETNKEYMPPQVFKLFAKYEAGENMTGEDMLLMWTELVEKGWGFFFMDNEGHVVPVISKTIMDMFKRLLTDEQEKVNLSFIHFVRLTLHAFVNIFGVTEKEKIIQYVAKEFDQWDDIKETAGYVLDNLLDTEDGVWQDKEYVISADLENRMEYRRILRQARENDYFSPSYDQIEIYKDTIVDENDPRFKAMEKNIKKFTAGEEDARTLLNYIVYRVVEEDAGIGDVAAIMADSVETFPSRHTDSFMESCNDWMYYVGRWANRGRSNAQMEKPKIGVSRQFLSEGHKKSHL